MKPIFRNRWERVVTFEQFFFLQRSNICEMRSTVQVGTILIKQWPGMPQLFEFETQPGFGEWSTVTAANSLVLDDKIHASGWNFFFMADEVKAMFFGSLSSARIQSAVRRILAKVMQQHFNGLEVTAIVARHFLGVPYVTVSAHSRHMQHSCNLDSAEIRQTSYDSAEWAKG